MKLITKILFSLTLLVFTSCTIDKSHNTPVSREDAVGYWVTTEASVNKLLKKTVMSEIITSFQLNPDSTVVAYFDNSEDFKLSATWSWKDEQKIGRGVFSNTINASTIIMFKTFGLKMFLDSEDGQLTFSGDDYEIVKQ